MDLIGLVAGPEMFLRTKRWVGDESGARRRQESQECNDFAREQGDLGVEVGKEIVKAGEEVFHIVWWKGWTGLLCLLLMVLQAAACESTFGRRLETFVAG